MGTMHHNAVIATTWDEKRFKPVWEWLRANAGDCLPLFVHGQGIINSQYTIVMLPDGSKEGWEHSDTGDAIQS
jgi:hypothetical protein